MLHSSGKVPATGAGILGGVQRFDASSRAPVSKGDGVGVSPNFLMTSCSHGGEVGRVDGLVFAKSHGCK